MAMSTRESKARPNMTGLGKRVIHSCPVWRRPFPVHGQGTVIFNINQSAPFSIIVGDFRKGKYIGVDVCDGFAQLIMKDDGETFVLEKVVDDHAGLDLNRKISYWLSYDRFHCTVKYGKGYRMEETTIMTHDFLAGVPPEGLETAMGELHDFFNPTEKKFISFHEILLNGRKPSKQEEEAQNDDSISLIDMENKVDFDYNPFVYNFPPFVYTGDKIDLLTIENGKYMLPASLPAACQALYTNIKDVELDFLKEYDEVLLSDAMRYSIVTPGCELNKKLKSKATEFGETNLNATYLRVTLGLKSNNSPGVAYVLEIWPVDHYSPIHNHGNSYAVIKVLFGGLTVHLYNKQALTDNSTEYDQRELTAIKIKAGDVTWISPKWYATHKLFNDTDDFCATIQCYQYSKEDRQHWPYFDYLTEDQTSSFTAEFLPDSDYTFREMHDIVIEEYKKSL